jgi:probable HAF family extracellular repeat protein
MHSFTSRTLVAPLAAMSLSSLLLATPVLAAPTHAQRASITDLGAPRGATTGSVSGLNDRGEVATTIQIGADSADTDVAVWRDGKWRDLGAGTAAGVTRDGRVVGFSASNTQHAVIWNTNGSSRDLGTLPGGFWSEATAANDRGQVVGYAQSTATHAFIWDADHGIRDLGAQSTGASFAYDINDAGQVIGSANNTAVMWDQSGKKHTLGAGSGSIAYAINRSGLVVGDANGHAFSWSSSAGFKKLPVSTGVGTSSAAAVNNAGEIVGSAQVTRGSALPVFHASLWQNGAMQDLNDLLPASSGWELVSASAINDRGQIAGNGVHNGQERAFLLNLSGNES